MGELYFNMESLVIFEKMGKRGQQMTLGTIIAIVLGIAVLVFLIFGFSTGWNNLFDKIGNLGGGKANVDAVIQGCAVACSSNSVDAYCRQSRTVNFGDKKTAKGSCNALEKVKGLESISCSTLSSSCKDSKADCSEGKDELDCDTMEKKNDKADVAKVALEPKTE